MKLKLPVKTMPYPREYVLLGPIEAAPLFMNREKAL